MSPTRTTNEQTRSPSRKGPISSPLRSFPPHRIDFYRNGGKLDVVLHSSSSIVPRNAARGPPMGVFLGLVSSVVLQSIFLTCFPFTPFLDFPISIQPKVAVSSLPLPPLPHSPSAVSLEPRGRQTPKETVSVAWTRYPHCSSTILSTVDHLILPVDSFSSLFVLLSFSDLPPYRDCPFRRLCRPAAATRRAVVARSHTCAMSGKHPPTIPPPVGPPPPQSQPRNGAEACHSYPPFRGPSGIDLVL